MFVETSIGEKIRVVCLFEDGKIKPLVFSWRKRVYKILQVVFSHSKNIGKERIFYFSVECEGGVFEISFNVNRFSWEIEKAF